MWYRRAHHLNRDDPVPEPFFIGSTPALSRLQVPPTSSRGRSISLPAPLKAANMPAFIEAARWNEPGPSLLLSPSGDVPPLVSTQGPNQASISSSSEALLEMTHDLLSRVQEQPREVTDVMRNMHADAMRASGRLLQKLSADDTETAGHIERLHTLLNECWRLIVSPANRDLNAWRDLRSAAGLVGIRLYSDVPQSWQNLSHVSHHDQQLMPPFISHLSTSNILSYESQEIPQMMHPHSENPEPDLPWPPVTYSRQSSVAPDDIIRSFVLESSKRGTYNPFNLNNAPLQQAAIHTPDPLHDLVEHNHHQQHHYLSTEQRLQPFLPRTAPDGDSLSAFSAPIDSGLYSGGTSMDFEMGERDGKGEERRGSDDFDGFPSFWSQGDVLL